MNDMAPPTGIFPENVIQIINKISSSLYKTRMCFTDFPMSFSHHSFHYLFSLVFFANNDQIHSYFWYRFNIDGCLNTGCMLKAFVMRIYKEKYQLQSSANPAITTITTITKKKYKWATILQVVEPKSGARLYWVKSSQPEIDAKGGKENKKMMKKSTSSA